MDCREINHRKYELMAKVKIINLQGKQTPVNKLSDLLFMRHKGVSN